jgi:hypothetical protein
MIAISADHYNQLRMMGHVPESFDMVIGRLLAEHNAIAAGAAKQSK